MSRSRVPGGLRARLVTVVAAATVLAGVGVSPAASVAHLEGTLAVSFGSEAACSTVSGDAVFVVQRPEVRIGLCVGEEPSGVVEADLELSGGGGPPVTAAVVGGAFGVVDGVWCARALWSPAADLVWGGAYDMVVSARVGGAQAGEPVSRGFELAPPVAVPTDLEGPSGGVTSSNAPELSASHVAVGSEDVRLRFSVSGPTEVIADGVVGLDAHGRGRWVPDVLLPAGEYSWKVRAEVVSSGLVSEWNEGAELTVLGPAVPQVLSPDDRAAVQGAPVVSLRLDVTPGKAASAIVQIAHAAGSYGEEFQTDAITSSGVVEWQWPRTWQRADDYRWRVRATDGVSMSEWTTWRSLSVQDVPDAPTSVGSSGMRGGATVHTWDARGNNSPVLAYEFTESPDGRVVTVAAQDGIPGRIPGDPMRFDAVFENLSVGSHKVAVRAINAWGASRPTTTYFNVAQKVSLPPADVEVSMDGLDISVSWGSPQRSSGVR